jgi:hypothetical protein
MLQEGMLIYLCLYSDEVLVDTIIIIILKL